MGDLLQGLEPRVLRDEDHLALALQARDEGHALEVEGGRCSPVGRCRKGVTERDHEAGAGSGIRPERSHMQ